MTLAELLATEPYASMSDADAAAAINAATVDVVGEIDSRALLRWAAAGGRLQSLRDAAADGALSVEVRSLAGAAVILIERDDTALDMGDPAMVGMVDALVAAGVLSASAPDDMAELMALATRAVPLAGTLDGWTGAPIGAGDIAQARA